MTRSFHMARRRVEKGKRATKSSLSHLTVLPRRPEVGALSCLLCFVLSGKAALQHPWVAAQGLPDLPKEILLGHMQEVVP